MRSQTQEIGSKDQKLANEFLFVLELPEQNPVTLPLEDIDYERGRRRKLATL